MYFDDDDSTAGLHAPRGTFEIYRAEGESLFKNGMFRKAIGSISLALDQKPGHKECLVLRSKCHLQLGELNAALTDGDATIKNAKKYYKGLYQKAEVLYAQGEFEQALVFYHRGHKLRPEIQDFRKGIQKAEEAIDNSVGDPDKIKLTKEGDLSYFEDQRIRSTSSARGSARRRRKSPGAQQSQRPRTRQDEQDMKRLLGELYGDKKYLEELLKEADNAGKDNQEVGELATDGITYLEKRANFWRQQLPPASQSKQAGKKKGGKSQPSSAMAERDPGKYVIKQLDLIDKEQAEGKFKESIKRCNKCMEKVNAYPEGTLPNRAEVIGSLHSCLGNAYLELGEYDKALNHYQRDHEIAGQQNDPEALARALANKGRIYSRQAQYQKAIDSWTDALRLCENNVVDEMWLNHEIGRCHLELHEYSDAKRCGDLSLDAARTGGDTMWQINALVLVAQSDVKLEEYAASIAAFEEALELAREQGDRPAVDAITKAIHEVRAKITDAQDNDEGTDDSDKGSVTGEYQISATPDIPTDNNEKAQETAQQTTAAKPTAKDPTPTTTEETKPTTAEPTTATNPEPAAKEESKPETSEPKSTEDPQPAAQATTPAMNEDPQQEIRVEVTPKDEPKPATTSEPNTAAKTEDDPKPATKDPKPAAKPTPTDSKSKEPKPAAKDSKPAAKESKPAAKESKPAAKESKPAAKEPKPAAKGSKPAAKESKPAAKESKPAAKESKPAKPAAKESKPAAKEPKTAAKESKPATKGSKPAAKESKPAAKESKPAKKA